MGSQTTFTRHILLVAAPGWGHLRPQTAFACKIVQERPGIAVTLLTVGGFEKRMEREIERFLPESESNSKANIRLVSLGGQGFSTFELMGLMIGGFQDLYEKLIGGQPIQCKASEKTFEGICKLNAAVVDFFGLPFFQIIRSVSGKSIPVFSWAPGVASVLLRLLGPEKFGGYGDVSRKASAEAKATGRDLKEIKNELYRPSRGDLVTVPGLPPMYDYEWSPQEPPKDIPQNDLFDAAYVFVQECDGIITITNLVYEPESVQATRAWLAETNRPFFTVGPLVPPGVGDTGLSEIARKKEMESSDNAEDFQVFLDKILKSHGGQSLIYVSFGTLWWPKNEYVWAFIDVLLELGHPFIFSHCSPQAVIPAGFADKVQKSGLGLLSTWSPQQTILNHPATGWILTHCGQNGITEALTQGIPMIAWPLDADQPANAAYLTLTLDVAFELIEVRTGLGLKPLYRGVQPAGTLEAVVSEARDVLHRLRGPEGLRKRRNAEAMRDKLKVQWEEGGDSLRSLREFLDIVSSQ